MKTSRTILPLCLSLVLPGLWGCDREDGRVRPAKIVATEYAEVPQGAGGSGDAGGTSTGTPPGKGIIKGKLLYTGAKPPLKQVGGGACHASAPMVPEDWLVVNDKNELANVVVYVKEPPDVNMSPPPAPVVDQKECVYLPHVVAAQTGQTVKFTSSDPVAHNVHVLGNPNGEYNQGMGKGDVRSYPVKAPAFARVKCDVHPWMSGYIAVFEHSFFAVTKNDGSFEIKGLPAGEYTVVCWHEKLKGKEQKVTVAEDKPSEVSVTLTQ